ncbi:recombination mediator RecR [Pseudogemmobacter sonorensis]|uniref:recombination mediator RecR n=1 Tax=Pseudogemmobacter sonorensis TaxID=2989681 RepID=UPI00368F49A9
MAQDDTGIEALIELMARLPGLGPRSARRAVLAMLTRRGQLMAPLAQAMAQVALSARDCQHCGNISTSDICPICADPARDTGEICVVEDVADLWALERTGLFKGRYHVLGGTLSALDGLGPEALGIPRLVARVAGGGAEGTPGAGKGAREVILALNATVEGQTTAHYIADALAPTGAEISTLAQGVPVGGELDYLDDGTIGAALRARRRV